MSSKKSDHHKEEKNDNSKQVNKSLDPNEIQNMLQNVDMKQVQQMLNNVNVNELQNSLKNVDFRQLAFIINILNSLTKNKK
ncbi:MULTISPECIES: hypothetical protein [Clostridium]|jgi:hypothetical protein|uniref:hypothetical protein n=1 Tax=Clostridium TaxID=1485 RepID=UPI000288E78F|nr:MULTISPECIES: hypothetical protein [Clostridium]MDF2506006.1 hypothetical protein [Clostridium sp.]